MTTRKLIWKRIVLIPLSIVVLVWFPYWLAVWFAYDAIAGILGSSLPASQFDAWLIWLCGLLTILVVVIVALVGCILYWGVAPVLYNWVRPEQGDYDD